MDHLQDTKTITSSLQSPESSVFSTHETPEEVSQKLLPLIVQYKQLLATQKFNELPDFCFVFQTFNKSHIIDQLLKPFLDMRVQNIIFFADGCVDHTFEKARTLLTGRNHIIINANDVHEIKNYRTSIAIADDIFSSKYLVLLQDDDLYESNLPEWLTTCSSLMDTFPELAIIGLNGGSNPIGPCSFADDSIQTTAFETIRDGARIMYRLGRSYTCEQSRIQPTRDGSNWRFCSFVNRAPQVIRLDFLRSVECFPLDMCPFQFDDYFNCLSAWSNGWKVIHMPITGVARNVGIGGMRLVNNVTPNSRPIHFKDNWNKVVATFGNYWEKVALDVAAANMYYSHCLSKRLENI